MKVIVGLGNPGIEYAHTRHNAGILFVDHLASLSVNQSAYGWRRRKEAYVYETPSLILAKTAGKFMNESGVWVRELLKNTPEPILYLAHDDLDIALGEFKIQQGVGPKVHNGVLSVEQALGMAGFYRLRIGVDNRDAGNRVPGEDYVLQRFAPEEMKKLHTVLVEASERVLQAP